MASSLWLRVVVVAGLTFVNCGDRSGLSFEARAQASAATYGPMTDTESASVRAFMQDVARVVTKDGPTAWLEYFDDSSAFFMAVNGAMAFPSAAVARDGTRSFAATIQHIELKWGDDMRVDPLTPELAVVGAKWHEVQIDKAGHRVEESGYFTGVVESKQHQWKFRDAHWSSPMPAAQAN
jgi:hypothetical protein